MRLFRVGVLQHRFHQIRRRARAFRNPLFDCKLFHVRSSYGEGWAPGYGGTQAQQIRSARRLRVGTLRRTLDDITPWANVKGSSHVVEEEGADIRVTHVDIIDTLDFSHGVL
jgi:hypothetical protein